jgi:hypothetical protein
MGSFAETSIVDYRLPTKEKNFRLTVSIFIKQTEVFCFPLAEYKWNLPFSVSYIFR